MQTLEFVLSNFDPLGMDPTTDLITEVYTQGNPTPLAGITATYRDATPVGDINATWVGTLTGVPDDYKPGYFRIASSIDNGFKPFIIDATPYVISERLTTVILEQPPPVTPSVCQIYGMVVDGAGNALANAVLLFEALSPPVEAGGGILVATIPVSVTPTWDGSFSVALVQGKSYRVTCDALDIYRKTIAVPQTGSARLDTLMA